MLSSKTKRVNITICAAICNDGVLSHKPATGPYNTERPISFLYKLHWIVVQAEKKERKSHISNCHGVGHCAIPPLHCSHSGLQHTQGCLHCFCLLNPTEVFFSSWTFKVHDPWPNDHVITRC